MFTLIRSIFSQTLPPAVKKVEAHPFEKAFRLEVDSWCYGLANLQETILPGVVHRVIKELSPILKKSLEEGYALSISEAAQALEVACGKVVPEKEIAFALIAQLPDPKVLNATGKEVFALIIAQAERKYGKVVQRVKEKFQLEKSNIRGKAAVTVSSPVSP
jgi:hypothetical protein